MTTMTRRAAIGAALATAAATPAAIAAPATASADDDAELLELGRRFEAMYLELEEAFVSDRRKFHEMRESDFANLECRIGKNSARTPAGLAVKARAAAYSFTDADWYADLYIDDEGHTEFDWEQFVVRKLIEDINSVLGTGAPLPRFRYPHELADEDELEDEEPDPHPEGSSVHIGQKKLVVEDYSMSLVYLKPGDVVYYDERERPPRDDIATHRCVVKLPDGRVLIRDVFKGSEPGTWTLIAYGSAPSLADQVVVWAEPVTAIYFGAALGRREQVT